jgi:predicted component of type VI protein secretion system
MDTNEEIRRRRLEKLCDDNGGVRAVADKAGMNWQALDQIIKKVLLPTKKDGTRAARALGDDTARKLEETYSLGRGWFDWPFEHVDFKAWAALNPYQRVHVEARLNEYIQDASQVKMPAALQDAKAVPNSKVKKHLPQLDAVEARTAHERAAKRARTSVGKFSTELDLFHPPEHE